ncbi:unnamed protein product, partial [Staurois parvus]
CFASAVPLLSSAFLAAISSAFLAAISSASWQQSHQLHLAEALVYGGMLSYLNVIRFSAHRAPYHHPKHGFSLSFLFSPTLCAKNPTPS